MAINYPTSLDTFTNPNSTDKLNNPSHSDQHGDANDAVEALQTKVGINGSADTNSLDYKVTTNTADIATNTAAIATKGDMFKATYDPTNVDGDAFSQDNMVDGTTNKNYTATEKTKLATVEANAAPDQNADEVPLTTVIGTPAYGGNIQSMNQLVNTSGIVDGCALTDNGDGTVDVASGTAFVRNAASSKAPLYAVTVAASAGITLTDNSMNFIYIDYNAGSPIFGVTTNQNDINCQDICLGYILHRDGNEIHYIDDREHGIDVSKKTRAVFRDLSYFLHAGGGTILSEAGALGLGVTAGSFYYTVTELDHPAFDTSVAGTANENVFHLYYRDGIGGWTDVPLSKTIDTTTYDDNSGTPASLGVSKYGVSWVYMLNNNPSELAVIMGQEQFNSQADAEAATTPASTPTIIQGLGALVGFVVYQQAATSFNNVLSAFAQVFSASAPNEHNALSGIQGGAASDYQHLTTAEYTVVQNTSGTNTGDQTSIVGIIGTTAEFNTALSDGSFATGGGTATGTNTGDQTDITGISSTKTQFNTSCSDGDFVFGGDNVSDLTNDAGYTSNTGDVVGPASATDNAIARFDLTTGKLIQNSGATIDDSGNLTANNVSGTNTGDQTSIAGITGTKAQFDTACTDGDFVYTGDNITGTAANVTGTVAIANGGTGATTLAGASIVTYTGTETLTNKTLTDPKLTYTVNTQTGTTYTFALTDQTKVVEMNNASANTITIPTNASVAFPTGTTITVVQYGAGVTTVTGDTGVTVNGTSAGSKATENQYEGLALYKRASDEWIVINR